MEVVLLASDKRRKIKTSVLAVWTFLHTIMSQFWEHMRQVLNWPPCELLATTPLIHAVACGVWTWCLEFGPIYRRCQYLPHRHCCFLKVSFFDFLQAGVWHENCLAAFQGSENEAMGILFGDALVCWGQSPAFPSAVMHRIFCICIFLSFFLLACGLRFPLQLYLCLSISYLYQLFPFVCGCGP